MTDEDHAAAAGKIPLADVFSAIALLKAEGFEWSREAIEAAGLPYNPIEHQLLLPEPGAFYVSFPPNGKPQLSQVTELQLNTIFTLVNNATHEGAQIWFGQSKDDIENRVGEAGVERGRLADATSRQWIPLPDFIASRRDP